MSETKLPKDFCPIPFLQLQMNPRGLISACCFSGEHCVGDAQKNTIEEIWNGEEIQRWRQEFIDGDIKICRNPIDTFQCHVNYQHLNGLVDLKPFQEKLPRRLDLRLNGQCNLECVMCDVWRDPNGIYDKSNFWEIGPEKIFPFLQEVDMLGGEPLIQRDTYRLIDAVSAVNPNCTWGFLTNGQYNFGGRIREQLDKIKIRHIHVSLDSIDPENYAKIRLLGKLDKALRTVEDLVKYRAERTRAGSGFAMFASMCVQKQNWREVPAFIDYCRERDIHPVLQNVVERPHLGLQALEAPERAEAQKFLREVSASRRGRDFAPVLNSIAATL